MSDDVQSASKLLPTATDPSTSRVSGSVPSATGSDANSPIVLSTNIIVLGALLGVLFLAGLALCVCLGVRGARPYTADNDGGIRVYMGSEGEEERSSNATGKCHHPASGERDRNLRQD